MQLNDRLEQLADATNLNQKELALPPAMPGDSDIIALVKQNVALAESQMREKGLQVAWDENDRLYTFRVPQQRWPGSSYARSSLGIPVVLTHCNEVNTAIQDILFEDDPFFYPLPRNDANIDEARAATDVLDWECAAAELEEEMDIGGLSTFKHGIGIWKFYWHMKNGYLCPKAEFIERKFIRVDRSLRRPDIRKAKFVAHCMVMDARRIDKLRTVPGFRNIPDLQTLQQLALDPKESPVRNIEERGTGGITNYSGVNLAEFEPQDRYRQSSVNPLDYPLSVIEYTDPEFVYTVLQNKLVIRKADNKKRDKVRYANAYCVRVEGQFDGIGFGQLIGGEQMLQQGLTNNRVDQLSLSSTPILKRKRGATIFPQQLQIRPALVADVDEMDDLDVLKLPSVDQVVYTETIASDNRAQRTTGAQDVAVLGSIPQGSGRGIGRTSEGIALLSKASTTRLRKWVKIFERGVLIPFLEFLIETNPLYLSKSLVKEILGEEARNLNLDNVINAKMKFKILAATKMKRREAMLASMPFLMEFLQQDSTGKALEGQFKKINFNKIISALTDATGWPIDSYFIEDMTEEEQQKLMSENPLLKDLITLRARTKIEGDAKIRLADAENAGRLIREIVKKILESGAANEQQSTMLQNILGQMQASREINQATAGVSNEQMVTPPMGG